MPATQRKCIYEGLTLDVDRHYIGRKEVTATTHQEKSIITLDSNASRGTILQAPHSKGWKSKNNCTPYIGINARQTYGKTTFHFTPHIWVLDIQTDQQGFLSPLTWGSKADRLTNYVSFHFSCWYPSKADRQITFHYIPTVGIQVRQIDKLRYISFLILKSK